MGKPRRYFPTNTPYFVTNRLAEGLPFVANLYINLMLFGILARASYKYPGINICAFLFLANHYHMILVLRSDPQQLARFMNYVDGEIAKLVVRWLGKRNVKVWAQEYHAAVLLTAESTFQKMVYTFTNPVAANLVAKASEWFGCTSFYALEDRRPREYKWILPSLAPRLPNGRFKKQLVRKLLNRIEETEAPSYYLHIKPFDWMSCFADTCGRSEDEMKERLYAELYRAEMEAAQTRKREKKTVANRTLLEEQNPHKHYKPTKFGRRVFCISSDRELRIAFIALYKEFCEQAQAAYQAWCDGFIDVPMPHGMFAPARGPRGSILPIHQVT